MKEQDKELLLKDVSARLPYGVVAHYILFDEYSLIGRVYLWTDECFYIKKTDKYSDDWTWNYGFATSCENLDEFKPYLRPMTSMTEEEEKEYIAINCYEGFFPCNEDALNYVLVHHLDFRGLIEKGLALPAPEGMYNF